MAYIAILPKENPNWILKILHITCWYPNLENPQEALWIKRHIEALELFCSNEVYHVEVKPSNKLRIETKSLFQNTRTIRILAPIKHWFIIEIISSVLASWVLICKRKKFDAIIFHIAYPNLTFIPKVPLNKPFFVIEHWSAYNLNFGVENQDKLIRIKRIFWNKNLQLTTVSRALGEDIKKFSDKYDLNYHVVPNVVDTNVFFNMGMEINENQFYMVSSWKEPKDPFKVIKAFSSLVKEMPGLSLRIGGYGQQIQDMSTLVQKLRLGDNVCFLGLQKPEQIALEMNRARAFLHCSEYETFSVVCAEALCCGCPVIASERGGIKELVEPEYGILVDKNDVNSWLKNLESFLTSKQLFNRSKISADNCKKFNHEKIGDDYFKFLSQKIDSDNK